MRISRVPSGSFASPTFSEWARSRESRNSFSAASTASHRS